MNSSVRRKLKGYQGYHITYIGTLVQPIQKAFPQKPTYIQTVCTKGHPLQRHSSYFIIDKQFVLQVQLMFNNTRRIEQLKKIYEYDCR